VNITTLTLKLLAAFPDGTGSSATPYHPPEIHGPDKSVEPSAAVDKDANQKSTASTTAELLCGVGDSTNAFNPLKSIAGSLYFILENCKVCSL